MERPKIQITETEEEYYGRVGGDMNWEIIGHCSCNRMVCEHAIEQVADLPKRKKNEKACGRDKTQ